MNEERGFTPRPEQDDALTLARIVVQFHEPNAEYDPSVVLKIAQALLKLSETSCGEPVVGGPCRCGAYPGDKCDGRWCKALSDASPDKYGAINNDLTRWLDKMHDAILDTEASGRPVGNLFQLWWGLKSEIEKTLSATTAVEDFQRAFREERVKQTYADGVWEISFTDATVGYLSGKKAATSTTSEPK